MQGIPLRQLFEEGTVVAWCDERDVVATHLACDSRKIGPKCVFFAIRGARFDGLQYIAEAVKNGCVAVVVEGSETPPLPAGVSCICVRNVRRVLTFAARHLGDFPDKRLTLIGVTGTNGKTTTTYLVQHLLATERCPVGLMGTIHYDLGRCTVPSTHTTPDAVVCIPLLNEMRQNNCRYAVMEVSSQGLDHERVHGFEFDTAAYLNLSPEHLDYHGSMEAYLRAKMRLFEGQNLRYAVVNGDDPYAPKVLKNINSKVQCRTFGLTPHCHFHAKNIRFDANGSRFQLVADGQCLDVHMPLLGTYNVYNVLAALAIAYPYVGNLPDLLARLEAFRGVPGRMQRVPTKKCTVWVDYAHTAVALQNTLATARAITRGRLIVVFGCGGNRDRAKRPEMLRVAQQSADRVYVTSDNPRFETAEIIFADMRAGVEVGAHVRWICDRREAIRAALAETQPDDTVVVAGKGHERGQIIGDTVAPFDDVAEVSAAVK